VNDEATPDPSWDEVVRRGRVSWLTHPPAGVARIEAESEAFGALPVSVPEGDPVPHVATPGELLAITHAMFMASFLADALEAAGSPADEIVVESSCTVSGPSPARELVAVDLHVRARVPGLDGTAFDELAAAVRRQSLRATGAREDFPGRLEAKLVPLPDQYGG
jgi:organic hydroperoxide reductase OsmC/OhrA